jgi:hypothetical protein
MDFLTPQPSKPRVTTFFRIYGCGTTVLGKRDFQPDGTHITTAWVTFLWIPIYPIKSYRIHRDKTSRFLIREVHPVHRKQAVFTYLFSISYIICLVLALSLNRKTHNVGLLFGFGLSPIIILLAMRWYAKRDLRLKVNRGNEGTR